ncbi:sulfatase-like hydrolase/transferase [Stieleria marina]|uniref:Arylsulfatase n=1 Tax=Stieleria marina TaxID=1930275 RepID=A0A517NM55_9BACT|nr:Arylsulfatase [Planctomycetes bacterium K23_9]
MNWDKSLLFGIEKAEPLMSIGKRRYDFWFLAALILVHVHGLISTPRLVAADRPNLIFVLTDDQRYDTLGCTGNGFIQTPNLDQLAAEGTLFANASVTSAICTPSRACYFLGQYERKHGVNFNSGTSMKPEAWAQSYPVLLRDAGYYTGYVGKNHVPIGNEGYDSNLIDESFDFWYAGHGHLTFYPKQRHKIFQHAKADTQTEVVGEGALSFLDSSTDYLQGAEAFFDRRPDGKPFCLSIALNLPHGAGTRSMKLLADDPDLYTTTYRDRMDQLSIPKTYVAKDQILHPKLPADLLFAQYRQTNYGYVDTPELLREQLVRKAQTITGIDRMMGEIRKSLADQGLADNTVIVFSSDHGIMAGEFGLGGKSLNYEPCLRIPMIVMDPRVPDAHKGRRTMALVESVDIAPTLLDLAGVESPESVQGKSFRGLLDGTTDKIRDSSFAENLWSTYFGNPRIESVRTSDWKYIRYFKNDRKQFASVTKKTLYQVSPSQVESYADWLTRSIRGEQPVYEELFHLASDPSESVNLVDRSMHIEKLDELRAECQRLVTLAKGDANEPPATVVVDEIREGKSKK